MNRSHRQSQVNQTESNLPEFTADQSRAFLHRITVAKLFKWMLPLCVVYFYFGQAFLYDYLYIDHSNTLISINLCILGASIFGFFVTVPTVSKMLKILKANGFSVNDVTMELKNVVLTDKNCFCGYTNHFLVLKKSIIIPFRSIIDAYHFIDGYHSSFIFSTMNNGRKPIRIRVGVFHSGISTKHYLIISECCKKNLHKLPTNFNIKTEYVDHSD